MSEVYKFTTLKGDFDLAVKAEFLKTCPEPHKIPLVELLTTQKVTQFFHNPSGPAIVRHVDKHAEYWIDGKKVNEEEAKRIEHASKFNDKLMNIVNEPTPT